MKFWVLFLSACTLSYAQGVPTTAKVSGKLRECFTNEAILGASLIAFDGKGASIVFSRSGGKSWTYQNTNSSGGYDITVPAGLVTLHFSRAGYTAQQTYDTGLRTMTRVLSLAPGETLKLDLCMDAQGR